MKFSLLYRRESTQYLLYVVLCTVLAGTVPDLPRRFLLWETNLGEVENDS